MRPLRDLIEAELAKGKLESTRIDALVVDENIVRMDWSYFNAIGGLRLMVAEPAQAILKDPIPDQIVRPDENLISTQPHCPKCGSLDGRLG